MTSRNQQEGNWSNQKKNPGTKATKEVVLQVEQKVVVKSQIRVTFSVTIVRSMVIILVIAQKSRIIKKPMQI